jgi:hypothetical protein
MGQIRTGLATLGFLAAATAAAQASPPVQDEILMISGGKLARGPLPAGPIGPPIDLAQTVYMIHALPSGKILAVTYETPGEFALGELLADGSVLPIGAVPWFGAFQLAVLMDMETDHRGRFYLLLDVEDPVHDYLVEVDPNTAAIVRSVQIQAQAIAYAPDGLWAVNGFELRKLDPDTLAVGPPLSLDFAGLGGIRNLEADSAGRLYFATTTPCLPYCGAIGLLDPTAEGLVEVAPTSLFAWANNEYVGLTIRRRCLESPTARCLQGGRFRAEITYTDYQGVSGVAKVAPARSSADTGVFSFFHPDNWELMVKVLDGCAINGHFWVYSSAATDVRFTMTVTDTQTGRQKVYQNPLGQVAKTVADGTAFSCSP